MSNLIFDDFNFENNLFKKLNASVIKNKQRISYIADGSINKNYIYEKSIEKFKIELKKGIKDFSVFSQKDILYITNEVATNRNFFNMIIQYNEFDTFVLLVKDFKRVTIYKKLFIIFFKYYSTLKKENNIAVLIMNLKSILRVYKGKNNYLLSLQDKKEYLFGSLFKILDFYKDNFEKIKLELHLQDDYEFSKVILNFRIIQSLKTLDYDENNEELFLDIILKKEILFDVDKALKNYVAEYLIDICINENRLFPNWQQFILRLLGDPRSVANFTSEARSWDKIDKKKKDFFIKTLSKDDLKLFLEALSDSNLDNNFHYRKAFWIQFINKVIFTKLLIGNDVYHTLNDEMQKNFSLKNDSYGKLRGLHNQSAIYIDFGEIKIIEFTYSGQVRGFSKCPIDLHKKEYSKSELDSLASKHFCLFSVVHAGAASYGWQSKLLEYMNRYLKTNISREDIAINNDKQKVKRFLHNQISIKAKKETLSSSVDENNDSRLVAKEKDTKDIVKSLESTPSNKSNYKTCKKCGSSKLLKEYSLINKSMYNPFCNDCLTNEHVNSNYKPTSASIFFKINNIIKKFK